VEISFSRFRIYRECPWKYRLQFVERRRVPLDPPSSLGVSLHRALERYHRGGEPRWEALAQAYDAEFLGSGYPDLETRRQWSRKGLRMLERYYRSEESRRTEVVASEREFIYPLGRHTVRGMIDRIDRRPDGRWELIDYKTFPGGDSGLQLSFYALGVKEAFGQEPALLTTHYLADGAVDTKPYDPSGEAALKDEIARVADRIEAGGFEPDTSFCPRCGFRRTCRYSVAR
jgi:putative RecB family exonuclease